MYVCIYIYMYVCMKTFHLRTPFNELTILLTKHIHLRILIGLPLFPK